MAFSNRSIMLKICPYFLVIFIVSFLTSINNVKSTVRMIFFTNGYMWEKHLFTNAYFSQCFKILTFSNAKSLIICGSEDTHFNLVINHLFFSQYHIFFSFNNFMIHFNIWLSNVPSQYFCFIRILLPILSCLFFKVKFRIIQSGFSPPSPQQIGIFVDNTLCLD